MQSNTQPIALTQTNTISTALAVPASAPGRCHLIAGWRDGAPVLAGFGGFGLL